MESVADELNLKFEEIQKNCFNISLRKEDRDEAFIYTHFFPEHILIYDFISYTQRCGYGEILFNKMLDFSTTIYADKQCLFIEGYLSETDRQKNNWFKSIPFYEKMFLSHAGLFSSLYYFNHNDPSLKYTPEYILDNIFEFKNIELYFRYLIM